MSRRLLDHLRYYDEKSTFLPSYYDLLEFLVTIHHATNVLASILLPSIHSPTDITRHIVLSFVRGAEADLNNDDDMKVSGYSSAINVHVFQPLKQLITPLNYHIMSKGLPSW